MRVSAQASPMKPLPGAFSVLFKFKPANTAAGKFGLINGWAQFSLPAMVPWVSGTCR
jgi:hypothetical protein